MSTDHATRVLSGIVPGRKDLLLYAIQHLSDDHFRGKVERGIWNIINRYYDMAGDVLPKNVLSDLLEKLNKDASEILLFEETFSSYENFTLEDHEFRFSVAMLKDQRAEQLTGESITTAFEILMRGAEVGNEVLKGHREARQYAYAQFADIDRLDNVEVAPEGDMLHEAKEVIEEYMNQRDGKVESGILTGIPTVDKVGGGFHRGELIIVAAFTNQGKSQFCAQTAWDAAIMQGKNVFFATSETVRTTIRRRIVARHSRLPQFGLQHGINTTDLKNGTLSKEEELALVAVVKDLDNNPNYGRIDLVQIPQGATLSYLSARMNRQAALHQIDLAVCDYLALLRSDRKRNSEREEMNEVLRDAKTFAVSFQEGLGVPLISPWQIRRESYLEALRTGAYGLSSLSDTSEVEKSADQILTFLRQPEVPNEASLQFLKMRDNEIPNAINVHTDFRNAYFGAKTANQSFGAKVTAITTGMNTPPKMNTAGINDLLG